MSLLTQGVYKRPMAAIVTTGAMAFWIGCAASPNPLIQDPGGALHRAIITGNADAAEAALRSGAGINDFYADHSQRIDAENSFEGGRPAFLLLRLTPLMRAARFDDYAIVKMLLQQGADVNARDELGCTALHYAAARRVIPRTGFYKPYGLPGDPRLVSLLVEMGAELDVQDRFFGWTPLMAAVGTNKDAYEIARVLVEAGADLELMDSAGSTALDIARRRGVYNADVRSLLGDDNAKP